MGGGSGHARTHWDTADRHAASFCGLRPDWPNGYILRQRAMTRLGRSAGEIAEVLREGLDRCALAAGRGRLEDLLATLQTQASEGSCAKVHGVAAPTEQEAIQPLKFRSRVKGLKLLPHELALFEAGRLVDVTHEGSSAIWLSAESSKLDDDAHALVYRPMGDTECEYLLTHTMLPDTQPYQTIVEGAGGRVYAEKYLRGHKSVDSSPTTVVEFTAPRSLIEQLFAMQSKNEDGAISHGLGDKGGRSLPLFNTSLQRGETTFRIVFVKRFEKRAMGAFGAGRRRC